MLPVVLLYISREFYSRMILEIVKKLTEIYIMKYLTLLAIFGLSGLASAGPLDSKSGAHQQLAEVRG